MISCSLRPVHMITTKPIAISKNKLLAITLLRYVKKRWWMIIALLFFGIYLSLKENPEKFDTFFMFFCLLYPLLIVIQYWFWVNSAQNKVFLSERIYEIHENKITARVDADTFSTVDKQHIISHDSLLGSYLLYLSKSQFFYIPADAFVSESDLNWFKEHYIQH